MITGNLGEWYVKLRMWAPDNLVRVLRKVPLSGKLAKSLQPKPGSVELYKLNEPLKGFSMLIPSHYVYTMVYGCYEPEVCIFLKDYLKPGWTVVDAGAHIGYLSLLMGKCVAPGGSVLSFEPLPQNLSLIYLNIALNKMMETVRVVPVAIADRSHLCKLHHHHTSSQAFIEDVPQEGAGDGGYDVVVAVSLDEYMRAAGWPAIDLIKMDIEGAETLAVMGMKETLRRCSPAILMETHGENARQGLRYLITQGYSAFKLESMKRYYIEDLESAIIVNERWLLLP